MLKLMCHCEDFKQMGKGQGFFAAKCVSMATAICVQYQKHHLFCRAGSLEEGVEPHFNGSVFLLFLFCFSSCPENHSENMNKPGSCGWRIPTAAQYLHINNSNRIIEIAGAQIK